MKALITGHTGFIGSHLDLIASDKFEITRSWLDPDIEVIFSIASAAEVSESMDKPRHFIRNNVDLIIDLLENARCMPKLKHFIHLSTSEVYGPSSSTVDKLEWSPIITHSPYAASKACQEAICMAYWKSYHVPVTIVNTMNVFGENQPHHKFIPSVVKKILSGEEIVIHGSPEDETTRKYIHADCVSDALIFLADQKYIPRRHVPPRVNLVGETEVSLIEIVSTIQKILDKDFKFRFEKPTRPGHGGRYSLDGSWLSYLGWRHPMSFKDSLDKTVRAIRASLESK